jgi:hypothetical protein
MFRRFAALGVLGAIAAACSPAGAQDANRTGQLLRRLTDPDFAVRTHAEAELFSAGIHDIAAFEAAAMDDPENASRIVALLERLFVGNAGNIGDRDWARYSCIGSADVILSMRRIGEFDVNPLTTAAEDALDRLAHTDATVASYAEAALSRHAMLRENRAIAAIREAGGRVVFQEESEPFQDAIAMEAMLAYDEEPSEAPVTPELRMIWQVYILPEWTGGTDGLQHLRRLRINRGLVVYLIDGCGLTVDDIKPLSADVAGVEPFTRGAATLGVSAYDPTNCQITRLIPGLAAANAGLPIGTVIHRVGKERVRNFQDLVDRLRNHKPGEVVTLSVSRASANYTFDPLPSDDVPEDEMRKIDVTLSSWAEMPDFPYRMYDR